MPGRIDEISPARNQGYQNASQQIARLTPVKGFGALGAGRLAVMDQGNGGTAEGNVAAINRQTEALRSLNEARMGTGDNRAFGDLLSIGRAGESFGDEAMRAEKIRGMVGDAATGRGLRRDQRMAMLEGAQLLAALNNQPSVSRLAPDPNTMTPYQHAQLTMDRERLAGTQALAQNQFDFNKSNTLAQQALDRDRLATETAAKQNQFAYQQGLLNQGREENAIKRLEIASKTPALTEYDKALQAGQAKALVDRQQAGSDALRNATDLFQKTAQLRDMADKTGMLNSGLAVMGSPFNTQRATDKERFDALSSDMVLSAIKQLGANPSNVDLAFVKKAAPGFGKTPEGNRQILSDMENFALGKLQAAGVDTRQFSLPSGNPLSQSQNQNRRQSIDQRGAQLAAQGMSHDQIMLALQKEFGNAR